MNDTLKTFGDKTPEFIITEQQIHDIGRHLQVMRQKIADAYNNDNLSDDYREVLVNTYYRCLGIAEFLGALYHNDIDDFIKNHEVFVDALAKNAAKDITS